MAANARFSEQARIGFEICNILGIEYQSFTREAAYEVNIEKITSNDFIDIRLYRQNRIKNKPKFLGLNPEYLSVSIPKIFSCNRLQLKLRIEQIVRIFLPRRILCYYSIDTRPTRGFIFKSKSIDRELLTSNLKKLQPLLYKDLSEADRDVITTLSKLERLAVIFPLLEQFGGNNQYHERMFKEILSELDENKIEHVLVKNHPLDFRDFSKLAEKYFSSKTLYAFPKKLVSLPVEILLTELNFDLYGTFSTAMLGLDHLAVFPSKLYLPSEKPWRDFLVYSQSSQYALINHKLKFI